MELGSYTERQRQRDPLNPRQQQNRYATAFAHPPAESSSGNQFHFYQDRGTALRSAFAGAAPGGTEATEGWSLHSNDAAVDAASPPDTTSNSTVRGVLNSNYSPYDVAYRGQAYADNAFDQEIALQPPHRKFYNKIRVLVAVFLLVGLSLCFFFQRRRALQGTSSRTAIDACDLDKEPACREYSFFDGFDDKVVQLVDEDAATGSFLFRSSLPLAQTTGRFMLSELTAAMRRAAEVGPLPLPERFRLILISLEWGEANGRLLEQCELAREACEARSFPQTATVHWPIYGQNVNPYSLPAHERDALAANFASWDGDNLEQKVQVLYRVTHSFLEHSDASSDTNSSSSTGGGETAVAGGSGDAAAAATTPATPAASSGSRWSSDHPVETASRNTKKKKNSSNPRTADNEDDHEEEEEDNTVAATSESIAAKGGEKQRNRLSNIAVSQLSGGEKQQNHNSSSSAPTSSPTSFQQTSGQYNENNAAETTGNPPRTSTETASMPLVSVVHCHHGKDRTALVVGAFKMRFLQYSFEQVVEENFALGQDLVESVNAMMWYCLYLEKGSPAGNGGPVYAPKCFDAIAAYPHINFISNGKAPHTPPGVLPPESSIPRPLRPVDISAAHPPAAAAVAPTTRVANTTRQEGAAAAAGAVGDTKPVTATSSTPRPVLAEGVAATKSRSGPAFRSPLITGQASESAPGEVGRGGATTAAAAESPQTRNRGPSAVAAAASDTPFPGTPSELPMASPGGTREGGLYVHPNTTQAFEGPAVAGGGAATTALDSSASPPGYPPSVAASEGQAVAHGTRNGADNTVTSSLPTTETMQPPPDTTAVNVPAAEQPPANVNAAQGLQGESL